MIFCKTHNEPIIGKNCSLCSTLIVSKLRNMKPGYTRVVFDSVVTKWGFGKFEIATCNGMNTSDLGETVEKILEVKNEV